ncbi:LysR family transcriptional regulator [Umezawaea sp. NPDC059074]|uniref:LysR family transcriptional regulator n=1 Tax=Umezawaea sp. NPDC059074 TaxID=3346716 RepID=UPI0036A17F87
MTETRYSSLPAAQAPEPDIDPRLLRAFLAVADEGHFGRAAERLHLAQPALSKQVRQLEGLLGVALFDRTSRGTRLTSAGIATVAHAERVLTQNARLVRAARSAAANAGEPVLLTVSAPLPSPSGGLLSVALRSFQAAHPGAQVSVTGLDDHDEIAALAAGHVDVVLTWDEHLPDGCAREILVDEQTSALLTQDHPRAGDREISVADLAAHTILFPQNERAHCWAQLKAAAQADHVAITAIPTAPSAVTDLVASGLGVSAVPSSFRFSTPPGVVFVPMTGLYHRMSVLRREDDTSAAVSDFVGICRSAARHLTAAHPDVWRLPDTTA